MTDQTKAPEHPRRSHQENNMTRDEQIIKAALEIAAATCEQSAYAADADGHHFAYSIRAIALAQKEGK